MDYGFVNKVPDDIKKGDFYMIEHFEVARTGQKQQYYTLYRDFTACLSGYWYNHTYQYKKNLSTEKNTAIVEAKRISHGKEINFYESPKPEIKKFEAFELEWKQGKKAFYAVPTFSFWEKWKKNKEEIKKAGFWVSKNSKGFMVFFKPNGILQ
jgi:hypothetical protein